MPRRALTPLEVPYVLTNTTSSGSFIADSAIDPDRLSAAFAALRREYPVLTGRIIATDNGFDLVTPDEATVEETAPISVEVRPFVPGDAHLGLQPEMAVAAVLLTIDGPLHRVTMGINHAIADGAHALVLNLRLWELYADPAAAVGMVIELPASPVDVADQVGALGVTPDSVTVHAQSAGVVPTPAAVDAGSFFFDRIVFDAAASTALRTHAKAAGLSLHGLLAGHIVLAERAELDASTTEPVPMAVFSPVDLRHRVTPPIAATSVTNFAGSSVTPIEVRGDSSPEEVGRVVLDKLRADLADGTAASALTGSAAVHVTGGAPVRLSNIGAIPVPTTPDGMAIVDFYTSSDVDLDRLRVMVRHLPPAALAPLVGMHYHAYTFDGRLTIEMRHAPGTMTADAVGRIRARIETALTDSVKAAA